jgi:hypothetical protein
MGMTRRAFLKFFGLLPVATSLPALLHAAESLPEVEAIETAPLCGVSVGGRVLKCLSLGMIADSEEIKVDTIGRCGAEYIPTLHTTTLVVEAYYTNDVSSLPPIGSSVQFVVRIGDMYRGVASGRLSRAWLLDTTGTPPTLIIEALVDEVRWGDSPLWNDAITLQLGRGAS